jgi:hypothetical protein
MIDRDKQIEALEKFARWVIRETCFEGQGLDGGEIQDMAETTSMIVKEPYDPAVHGATIGEEWDVAPGDTIFVFAPWLKEKK